MTHWTDGPIAAFDVETTGVDVEQDRIVSYCVGLKDERGWRSTGWIVNPGVPIPEQASQVHGITTERAQNGSDPRNAVDHIEWALREAWKRGAPVVIYNAPFDLTILDRELRRYVNRGLTIEGPVIDPLVLDKAIDTYRKGSRRLTEVCKHYGVTLAEEDAHSASGDARAALELAVKVAQSDQANIDTSLTEMSLAELYRFQAVRYRMQRESFFQYLASKGEKPDDTNTVWPMKPWNGSAA